MLVFISLHFLAISVKHQQGDRILKQFLNKQIEKVYY